MRLNLFFDSNLTLRQFFTDYKIITILNFCTTRHQRQLLLLLLFLQIRSLIQEEVLQDKKSQQKYIR